MAKDVIKGVILKDAVIKSETGTISGPNHDNAEQFFVRLKQLTGGEEQRESSGSHEHQHNHSHLHQHE